MERRGFLGAVAAVIGVGRPRTWRGLQVCLEQARLNSFLGELRGLSDDGTESPLVILAIDHETKTVTYGRREGC